MKNMEPAAICAILLTISVSFSLLSASVRAWFQPIDEPTIDLIENVIMTMLGAVVTYIGLGRKKE